MLNLFEDAAPARLEVHDLRNGGLAILSNKKSRKEPMIAGLIFGAINALFIVVAAVVQVAIMDVPAAHAIPVIVFGVLLRGMVAFLSAWALLALLKRIDAIEIAVRLAPQGTSIRKKPVVLEWCGVVVAGFVCALS